METRRSQESLAATKSHWSAVGSSPRRGRSVLLSDGPSGQRFPGQQTAAVVALLLLKVLEEETTVEVGGDDTL